MKKYSEFGYGQPELQTSALPLAGRAPPHRLEPSSCPNPIGKEHLDTFLQQDQQPSFSLFGHLSQLPSRSSFPLPTRNLQPSSHRTEPSAKSFRGWRGKGWRALCFFHHLIFCRYKKKRCLRLERNEHEPCNPRNGNLEILTARVCFKDFKHP